jgi:hypothetical protein
MFGCLLLIAADLTGAFAQSTPTPTRQAAPQNPTTRHPAGPAPALTGTTNDWLQFDGDDQHSGNSTKESILSSANVASLSQLFQASLPTIADGAPSYLSQVATGNGTQDLLFVTAKAGDILALDAHTGAQLWSHSNPANGCHVNNGASSCYTTSSPAVDPNRQFVYSYGLDGNVHKYAVGTGDEVLGNGWPELATLKGFDEKGSSALSIATARSGSTYLYVTNSGYPGDGGNYQGHVTAINLASGAQTIFSALCSNQAAHFVETPGAPDCPDLRAAIWARAGVIYDAGLD